MRTLAIIVSVGLVSVAVSEYIHYIINKSFDNALKECAQYYEVSTCDLNQYVAESYPDKPEVRRLVRCTLINLQSWYDSTGLIQSEIVNFFEPSPADDCYVNRTQACLNALNATVDPTDVYNAAYQSFMCYFRNYGNLVSTDQFLRYAPLEYTQALATTTEVLELSQDTLVEFCKGNILNNDQFPTFLYQSSVRFGFFTVLGGVQLKRLYNQFGNAQLLAPETQQCVQKVAEDYCGSDDTTIMFQTHVQCLKGLVPTVQLLREFAKTQVSDPSVCDCTSPQIQVYNLV
ncbi:hypothetical protein RP20_CCG021149 [Aedes albopictus]|nr:hypothetical protein RP20_CCG021149 [Aedes albopictus]